MSTKVIHKILYFFFVMLVSPCGWIKWFVNKLHIFASIHKLPAKACFKWWNYPIGLSSHTLTNDFQPQTCAKQATMAVLGSQHCLFVFFFSQDKSLHNWQMKNTSSPMGKGKIIWATHLHISHLKQSLKCCSFIPSFLRCSHSAPEIISRISTCLWKWLLTQNKISE